MSAALTSSESFTKLKRVLSAKHLAHNKEVAVLGAARSLEVRQEKARVRKISAMKQNEKTNQILMQSANEFARAAKIPALGATYIYKLGKDKKSVQVRDPDEIGRAYDLIHAGTPYDEAEGLYYSIVQDKPDIKAIEIIWNKMFGKAIEKKEVEVHFSLRGLARIRQGLPELAPMPVEARVLDEPKDE